MGTETIVALVLFWSFKIPHVKLNNPLMGTETTENKTPDNFVSW